MIPKDESYPSNNIDSKESSKPKQEKIVTGKIHRRKKSGWDDISNTIVSVLTTIGKEVLVPALKDMLYDAITQGANRTIYGENGAVRQAPSRNAVSGRQGFISYNRYSTQHSPRVRTENKQPHVRRSNYSFDDTIFESRDEAETVLDRMYDILSQHEYATVADFYDLIGVKSNYVDENWGWVNLQGSNIYRDRSGGFTLSLPKPEVLD